MDDLIGLCISNTQAIKLNEGFCQGVHPVPTRTSKTIHSIISFTTRFFFLFFLFLLLLESVSTSVATVGSSSSTLGNSRGSLGGGGGGFFRCSGSGVEEQVGGLGRERPCKRSLISSILDEFLYHFVK